MKTLILLVGILISFQGVWAQETNLSAVNAPPEMLRAVIDLTWASQYISDGFKIGDSPVWEVALKTRLFQTAFSVMLWGALQTDREQKKYDEGDVFLMFSHDFFENKRFKINVHGFYDYWILPNTEPQFDDYGDVLSNAKRRGNKFQAGFTFPKLLPLGGSFIIPSYNAYYWLYYVNDREDLKGTGIRHELAAEYDQPIRVFLPKATYQYAGAAASINYHTGVFGVSPGISHLTSSIRSGVYALQSIFEASLNYQWTLEKTVHLQNEIWSTASFIKKF